MCTILDRVASEASLRFHLIKDLKEEFERDLQIILGEKHVRKREEKCRDLMWEYVWHVPWK